VGNFRKAPPDELETFLSFEELKRFSLGYSGITNHGEHGEYGDI
jgi:hypothetical protein